MICWPGKTIGRPVISSCSFAKAIIEPAKLTAPMMQASTVGISVSSAMLPDRGIRSWYSDSATSATAPPPTPLNSATICGIAVIFTARAEYGADGGADRDRRDDQPVVLDLPVEQRRDDRDRHADGRDAVALAGRARVAQAADAEDEQRSTPPGRRSR